MRNFTIDQELNEGSFMIMKYNLYCASPSYVIMWESGVIIMGIWGFAIRREFHRINTHSIAFRGGFS